MDPETAAFRPRDDAWRFAGEIQGEMLHIQQSQAELDDRVSRLERRHDEDARLKNVWGTSSPFPSVLGGTPQQGTFPRNGPRASGLHDLVPLQQPRAEDFSNFDTNPSNLIGNLQLDADEEPRRLGTTSRANSVRFDETANHAHWAQASRSSSLELLSRNGSGLGGLSMSERSFSHKSDGRQSSAGHSVHSATSGRANSLTGYGLNTPVEPPALAPGYFYMGPVPAIIRCWLTTNFKHGTLLYAAVCSGSYASYLDIRLINRLGFQDRVTKSTGEPPKIKLPVYLSEAVPVSASSRSSSAAPELPCVDVEFQVVERSADEADTKTVQIILGSDMLRRHNADILFSTDQLILYDDECSKLQIPLVRPEDEKAFKSLFTMSGGPNSVSETASIEKTHDTPAEPTSTGTSSTNDRPAVASPRLNGFGHAGDSHDDAESRSLEQRPLLGLSTNRMEAKDTATEASPTSAGPRSGTSPAIWSNWRRDTDKPSSLDWGNAGKSTDSKYQRRDTGIKVLKPMKASSRVLSSGTSQSSSTATSGQSRFFDDGKRRISNVSSNEAGEPQLRRSVSGEKAKEVVPTSTKLRTSTANPVGGASAFGWMK